jgi:ribonucleoside-diphosphate reductase alpha chain
MNAGSGYLLSGENVDERVWEICNTAEKRLKKPGFAKKFRSYFQRGWYSFSTPIWANFGTDRGLPISCYNSHISDSIDSILGHAHAEIAMMTKLGGGTSAYYGEVRGRGEPIQGGKNGQSFGSVHFAKHHESLIQTCSQGSCYAEGTEVLTDRGYVDFRYVRPTDKLAQLDDRNRVSFTSDYELVRNPFRGNLKVLRLKKQGDVVCRVTPNHRMVVTRLKMEAQQRYWPNNTEIVAAADLKVHRGNRIPAAGHLAQGSRPFTFADRFRVAFQANGKNDSNTIRFRLKKTGKVKRLLWIASGLGVECRMTKTNSITDLVFDHSPDLKVAKFSDWVSLADIDKQWAVDFLDELGRWGTQTGERVNYYSTDRENVDFVQAVASICGRKTRLSVRPANGARRPLYKLTIVEQDYRSGESLTIEDELYDGTVYCAVVPHGRLLVRTNGQVTVCGNTRRGNFAGYWPIDHPDIMEVLRIKTDGFPIQHIFSGVCVGDQWLTDMVNGDRVKREVWAEVIRARQNTGIPYILFIDTVNRARPQWYKDQNLVVKSSNLCVETTPTSNEEESFVCDLSSMNVRYFLEWKDTDAPYLMTYFLDAVMSEFIEKASSIPYMERAVRYAARHRSLGVGWFGWHHLLQSQMIPFEGMEAKNLNSLVARTIQRGCIQASEDMAREYGEPEVTKGYGRRHALLQAIAPTTSSAFIINQTSESIEPLVSNYEVKDLAKGKFTVRNPYLTEVLKAYGKDDRGTWQSILERGGSVQHLSFLTQREREVFKTFPEISQLEIVQQAAQRQQYIDQGQSLNLFLTPNVPTKEVNQLLLEGWRSGVKSFYYNKGLNAAQQLTRSVLSCTSCEA